MPPPPPSTTTTKDVKTTVAITTDIATAIVMRLLKSVARRSLLAFGYPKLETSHPELGVHDVGAFRARMSPDVPACQFFYPCCCAVDAVDDDASASANDDFTVPYFRPAAVEGLVKFLGGFGDGILQFLEETPHPLQKTYGADPLLSSSKSEGKEGGGFPLVIFSHGLSGTMEMYTELCSQIASTGCVVVAVEHEDGTASHAETPDGTVIPYDRPRLDGPYSRSKVIGFRMPKLERRVMELRAIYDRMVRRGEEEEPISPDDAADDDDEQSAQLLVERIVSAADPSRLHLVGHSFGGATQLLAAQTWMMSESSSSSSSSSAKAKGDRRLLVAEFAAAAAPTTTVAAVAARVVADLPSEPSPPLLPPIPRSVTVFDAWNFAMSEEAVEAGLVVSEEIDGANDDGVVVVEVLSVLSEEWATTNPEREVTSEFLRNCRGRRGVRARSVMARDSVHQSVSDAESWVPSLVATRMTGNRGKGEPRHRTIRAIVREVAGFAAAEASASDRIDDDDDETNTDGDTEPVLVDYPL